MQMQIDSERLKECPFCGGKVTQEIKESPYKDGTGAMFTSKLVHDCLEGFEAGYAGGLELFCTNNPTEDSRKLIDDCARHQRLRWSTRPQEAKLRTIVKELREALEFYAYFPYKEGLVHVKAEDVPPPINWEKIQPSDIIPIAKYSYDKGDVAKQALLRAKQLEE